MRFRVRAFSGCRVAGLRISFYSFCGFADSKSSNLEGILNTQPKYGT